MFAVMYLDGLSSKVGRKKFCVHLATLYTQALLSAVPVPRLENQGRVIRLGGETPLTG